MSKTNHARLRLAAAAVITSALLAGCASTDSSSSEAAPAERSRYEFGPFGDQGTPGEPTRGGVLEFADYGEIRSLSPAVSYATGASGGGALLAVYDSLMKLNTETQQYEPQLAESLEPSDDHTTWTLTLRDGVTFSDGTRLDAEAVVGSINWYMENQGVDTALLAPNLDSMKTDGDRTVVFVLKNPWSTFPALLSQAVGMIVAPAARAGDEFEPIGAGPFVFDSYRPTEELVLKANKDYWDGAPPLDGIRFTWPASDEARFDALRNGDADIAYMRDPKVVDDVVNSDYSGHLTLTSMGNTIAINNREGYPGADPRIRRAIALAYDPTLDFERSYDGKGLPGKEMFPPESHWDTSEAALPVDLEEAARLVEEAKADGFDGKISYLDGADPTSRTQSVAIKAMLERVGFVVETEMVSSVADQMARVYVNHDFDLARGAVELAESDPYARLIGEYGSTSWGNAIGYQSPEMDSLLAQLQAAGSDEDRQAVLDEMQALLNEDVPNVVSGASAAAHAWTDRVRGVEISAEYMPDFSDAWLVQ